MITLIGAQLRERRRSPLSWGLPIGLWSAFVVAIYPSVEHALSSAIRNYPKALKEAFGIGELTSVGEYLHAEMLSLLVPLAVGYLAARSIASALSGASESGWLDELLSAPVSRSAIAWSAFAAAAVELAAVLLIGLALAMLASVLFGAHLGFGAALAGYANVWPLGLFIAGLTIVATGFSLRTVVITGTMAGVLVFMYVLDLLGRLDTSLDGVRYLSVFRWYGDATRDGIDLASFIGVTAVAVLLAGLGTLLFERRDL